MTRIRKSPLISLWPLLVPLLVLLPGIGSFPYPPAPARFSDFSISHYPNALFLQRAILDYHQIPLWSPTILSGYPFAANPLSGLWYPLGWPALLFPLPLGINIMAVLHLLLGGVGFYLLARRLGRSHPAALFAGIAFEALPRLFAYFGAGYLTTLYAISLTPWLLLVETRRQQRESHFWTRQPGLVLALIALADPRWAVYAGLLWLTFLLWMDAPSWRVRITELLKQFAIAMGLAAPALLPLFEYGQLSTRTLMAPADVLTLSLPFWGLLGFLAPPLSVSSDWMVYMGASALLLTLTSIVNAKKSRMQFYWLGVIGLGLLYSFGGNIPGFDVLVRLPGLSLLRVPPRVLPLVAMAALLLASEALDQLLARRLSDQTWRRMRLAFVAVLAFQLCFALIIAVATRSLPRNYLWAFGLSLMVVGTILLFASRRISARAFWVSLLVLTLLDLGATDASLFSQRPRDVVLGEHAVVAKYLAQQPGPFRVYSPSISLPQQTSAYYGLQLADGVDPLQLRSYSDFMEEASGVQRNGYSITLPTFFNDPAIDNQYVVPDVERLAILNVKYLASEFELSAQGLKLIDRFDSTFLYELTESKPRAWIEGRPDKQATLDLWTPNRIELTAEGPGTLVLSELIYPGWQAHVDGAAVGIEPFDTILRSVDLAPGVHHVVFTFRPRSVGVGMLVFLIAMAALVLASRREKRRIQSAL